MPQRDPVGKIRRLSDRVEDVAVVLYVRLWDSGHDGSLWCHLSAIINILPISGNINNTIQTPDGEVVPVTVSQSGSFLEVDDGWLNSGVYPFFCVRPETFTNQSGQQWHC